MKSLLFSMHCNTLLSVDLAQDNVEQKLLDWFEANMPDKWNDLSMHEGGSAWVSHWGSVTFSGDDGLIEFEPIEISEID